MAENEMPSRHAERHASAMKTVTPAAPAPNVHLTMFKYLDGRIGWPAIVQYRMPNGEIRGVPPTNASDPDLAPPPKHAILQRRDDSKPRSLPYEIIIHDPVAYEELARSGVLYSDEHLGAAQTKT